MENETGYIRNQFQKHKELQTLIKQISINKIYKWIYSYKLFVIERLTKGLYKLIKVKTSEEDEIKNDLQLVVLGISTDKSCLLVFLGI